MTVAWTTIPKCSEHFNREQLVESAQVFALKDFSTFAAKGHHWSPTLHWCDFSPLFLQSGFLGHNFVANDFPEVFYWVQIWSLGQPFYYFSVVSFKEMLYPFGCVTGRVVLLEI